MLVYTGLEPYLHAKFHLDPSNCWMDQDEHMKLGTELGLDTGHIVLDGDPAPPQKREGKGARPLPPIFGPCLFWPNGWMDQDATWYQGRPWPRRHCVRWDPAPSPQKGGTATPIFRPRVVAKWLNGDRQNRQTTVR